MLIAVDIFVALFSTLKAAMNRHSLAQKHWSHVRPRAWAMSLESVCQRFSTSTFAKYFHFCIVCRYVEIFYAVSIFLVTPTLSVPFATALMGAISADTVLSGCPVWAVMPRVSRVRRLHHSGRSSHLEWDGTCAVLQFHDCNLNFFFFFLLASVLLPRVPFGEKRFHTQNPRSDRPVATNFAPLVLCTCNLSGSPARPESAARSVWPVMANQFCPPYWISGASGFFWNILSFAGWFLLCGQLVALQWSWFDLCMWLACLFYQDVTFQSEWTVGI